MRSCRPGCVAKHDASEVNTTSGFCITPDDLLLPSDVARLLGVSSDSVRNWSEKGALPSMRTVTGRRFFRRSDVEAFRVRRAISPRGKLLPVTDVSGG